MPRVMPPEVERELRQVLGIRGKARAIELYEAIRATLETLRPSPDEASSPLGLGHVTRDWVRNRTAARRLTQTKLAAAIGLTQDKLSKSLGGHRHIPRGRTDRARSSSSAIPRDPPNGPAVSKGYPPQTDASSRRSLPRSRRRRTAPDRSPAPAPPRSLTLPDEHCPDRTAHSPIDRAAADHTGHPRRRLDPPAMPVLDLVEPFPGRTLRAGWLDGNREG